MTHSMTQATSVFFGRIACTPLVCMMSCSVTEMLPIFFEADPTRKTLDSGADGVADASDSARDGAD